MHGCLRPSYVHCIRACPKVPARHCGSGPSLVLPAEACVCLPWRPRTLTQGPSLQLEQAVRLESGELETQEPRGLVRQSVELRRQLQEEQASYRRKLQAYQEGQQRQAQLVQRLQAKVRATHSCSCLPLCLLTSPCPHPPGLTIAHHPSPDSPVQEEGLRAGAAAVGEIHRAGAAAAAGGCQGRAGQAPSSSCPT